MTSPDELKYTVDHEWVDVADDVATVGITDVAATRLGDVVYLDLPAIGAALKKGEVCGEIESTKSVGELYAPVSGEVLEVNDAAAADPSVVNADAFGDGWLVRVRVAADALDGLMDRDAYVAFAGDA